MMGFPGGIAALIGGIMGACLAGVPGLHIVFLVSLAVQSLSLFPELHLWSWAVGLITGFVIGQGLTLVAFSSPDENSAFAAVPAGILSRQGKANEAVTWMASGALIAVVLIAAVGPSVSARVSPHDAALEACRRVLPWAMLIMILIRVTSFGSGSRRPSCRAASVIAMALSGLLGLALLSRSPIDPLGLAHLYAPALIGFFTLPHVILAHSDGAPRRHRRIGPSAGTTTLGRGLLCGSWTGALLACLPAVTGASAGFLCGQFREQDPRTRLFAHGAATATFLLVSLATLVHAYSDLLPTGRPGAPHGTVCAMILAAGAAYLCLSPLTQILAQPHARGVLSKRVIVMLIVSVVLTTCGAAGLSAMLAAGGVGLLLRTITTDPSPGLALVIAPLIITTGGL